MACDEVTYVEIDPLIIAAGRRFLPENLADPRIRIVTTDGRRFVQQTGGALTTWSSWTCPIRPRRSSTASIPPSFSPRSGAS